MTVVKTVDTVQPIITVANTPYPSREIVLIHGMTGSPEELIPAAKIISTTCRARLWLPQLKGHDRFESLKTTTTPMWTNQALEVLEHIRSQSSQPLSIIGVSFGGILGMYAAQRYPAIVENLVLLAPPWHIKGWWQESVLSILARLPEGVLNIPLTKKKQSLALVLPRKCFSHHWIGSIARLAKIRNLVVPESIRAKVLVMSDPHDHQVSVSQVMHLAHQLPRGSFLPVDEGTHELLLGKHYSVVAREISNFILSD